MKRIVLGTSLMALGALIAGGVQQPALAGAAGSMMGAAASYGLPSTSVVRVRDGDHGYSHGRGHYGHGYGHGYRGHDHGYGYRYRGYRGHGHGYQGYRGHGDGRRH